jgi:hypothetical protein
VILYAFDGNRRIYMSGSKERVTVAMAAVSAATVRRLSNGLSIFVAETHAILLAMDEVTKWAGDSFLVLSNSFVYGSHPISKIEQAVEIGSY